MNRRRFLLGGKVKPFWIFKLGTNSRIGTRINESPIYYTTGGFLSIRTDTDRFGNIVLHNMCIGGISFSKYKTLNIECKTSKSYISSEPYQYFYCGYGVGSNPGQSNYQAFQNITNSRTVKTFDISAIKGERYIKISSEYPDTECNIEAFNIWLE